MENSRIYTTSVSSVYPHYVAKAERRGRTKAEVDQIICWLSGYCAEQLDTLLNDGTDFQTFFDNAPALNPNRKLITGKICGIQVENMEESTMKEIRYLDKLVDELTKTRPMNKILRST